MIHSSRRRGGPFGATLSRKVAPLVAVAAAGVVMSGCGAGQIAQTAAMDSTVDGVNGRIGPISIADAAIDYPPDGYYRKGDRARLEFVVVNAGASADQLVAIRSDAATTVSISLAGATTTPPLSGSLAPPASPSPTPSGTGGTGGSTAASPSPSGSTGSTSAGSVSSTSTGPTGSASAGSTAAGPTSSSPTGSASPSPTGAATVNSAPLPVPGDQLVSFRADGAVVTLVGLTQDLLPSAEVHVTFVFAQAGELTLPVPVAISPSPLPTPSPIDIESPQPAGVVIGGSPSASG